MFGTDGPYYRGVLDPDSIDSDVATAAQYPGAGSQADSCQLAAESARWRAASSAATAEDWVGLEHASSRTGRFSTFLLVGYQPSAIPSTGSGEVPRQLCICFRDLASGGCWRRHARVTPEHFEVSTARMGQYSASLPAQSSEGRFVRRVLIVAAIAAFAWLLWALSELLLLVFGSVHKPK